MFKLLVDSPTGEQQLIEVGAGGGYFDASRVLWDERVDGDMPTIQLGGMARQDSGLVFSPVRMAEHAVSLVQIQNTKIKAQIAALDQKRIRPLAEGDTVYLAQLNEQIVALRAQLK